jgi:hypothetical protein
MALRLGRTYTGKKRAMEEAGEKNHGAFPKKPGPKK